MQSKENQNVWSVCGKKMEVSSCGNNSAYIIQNCHSLLNKAIFCQGGILKRYWICEKNHCHGPGSVPPLLHWGNYINFSGFNLLYSKNEDYTGLPVTF